MASPTAVTVRPVASIDEYRACQEIQRRAWGITEDGYVVPVATMISVQHVGGLVLGAFADDRLIGFAFAYLGRVRERWALYSQLTGVDPAVQSHGVGGALKQAQRAWARDQGLELVAWSFDPLQAGNANLNLHRLGAIARTYEVNYFGERTDALNAGLDTDRLLVEWPVQDEPRAWQGDDLEPLALVDGSGLTHDLPPDAAEDLRRSIAAGPPLLPADGRPLQIDVPPLLASLKSEHPALARTWQRAVRDAFVRAFAGRYVAMDFVRHEDENGAARASYVLRRPAP